MHLCLNCIPLGHTCTAATPNEKATAEPPAGQRRSRHYGCHLHGEGRQEGTTPAEKSDRNLTCGRGGMGGPRYGIGPVDASGAHPRPSSPAQCPGGRNAPAWCAMRPLRRTRSGLRFPAARGAEQRGWRASNQRWEKGPNTETRVGRNGWGSGNGCCSVANQNVPCCRRKRFRERCTWVQKCFPAELKKNCIKFCFVLCVPSNFGSQGGVKTPLMIHANTPMLDFFGGG